MDKAELTRIMPRMRTTGTKFARIMSYPNDGWVERDWRTEVIRRLRELARMAEGGGIVQGIENCDGWAGKGPEAMLDCLADVGSPALKVIFWQIGNDGRHQRLINSPFATTSWDGHSTIYEEEDDLWLSDLQTGVLRQ